jgi:HAMP domain-containing protein
MHVKTGKIAFWILVAAFLLLAIAIWVFFDGRIHRANRELHEYRTS